jgi:hypothetical protein
LGALLGPAPRRDDPSVKPTDAIDPARQVERELHRRLPWLDGTPLTRGAPVAWAAHRQPGWKPPRVVDLEPGAAQQVGRAARWLEQQPREHRRLVLGGHPDPVTALRWLAHALHAATVTGAPLEPPPPWSALPASLGPRTAALLRWRLLTNHAAGLDALLAVRRSPAVFAAAEAQSNLGWTLAELMAWARRGPVDFVEAWIAHPLGGRMARCLEAWQLLALGHASKAPLHIDQRPGPDFAVRHALRAMPAEGAGLRLRLLQGVMPTPPVVDRVLRAAALLTERVDDALAARQWGGHGVERLADLLPADPWCIDGTELHELVRLPVHSARVVDELLARCAPLPEIEGMCYPRMRAAALGLRHGVAALRDVLERAGHEPDFWRWMVSDAVIDLHGEWDAAGDEARNWARSIPDAALALARLRVVDELSRRTGAWDDDLVGLAHVCLDRMEPGQPDARPLRDARAVAAELLREERPPPTARSRS